MTKQVLYRHFDAAGRLLYVGISLCPFTRTRQHGMAATWFDDVVRIEIERFEARSEAESAEWRAIKNERPLHNQTFNKRAPAPQDPIIVVNASLEQLPNPIIREQTSTRPHVGRPLTKHEMFLERQANVTQRMKVRS